MHVKWIAAIAAWFAGAAAVSACAYAWGPQGRWAVVLFGSVLAALTTGATGIIAGSDKPAVAQADRSVDRSA